MELETIKIGAVIAESSRRFAINGYPSAISKGNTRGILHITFLSNLENLYILVIT